MQTRKITALLFLAFITISMMGCTSVKEYQKAYINDAEMVLARRRAQLFELNFLMYREGAAGANGGKSGGGCGCN